MSSFQSSSTLLFLVLFATTVPWVALGHPGVVHVPMEAHRASASDAPAARDVGGAPNANVPLTNYAQTQFFVPIRVGTPPQEFKVIVDTSTSFLSLPSHACKSFSCKLRSNLYDASHSSTARADGRPFSINYGPPGEITGALAVDTMQLGSLSVGNQTFGAGTTFHGFAWLVGKFDGVLGLAPAVPLNADSGPPPMPPLDSLFRAQELDAFLFALYISRRTGTHSELSLGGVNPARYTGELQWADVVGGQYWQVKVTDVRVGDTSLGWCGDDGCAVAIASESPSFTGPVDQVKPLIAQLGVRKDCSNVAKLPAITYVLDNGVELRMEPDEYVFKERVLGATVCSSGFFGLDKPAPLPRYYFGDEVLQKWYTVYDRTNMRIGFAEAVQE